MRSSRIVLGMILIVMGLILSFVFPIMSIVPNMVIEYPPSQVQGDGATFSEGKYIFQEFTSDVNLKFTKHRIIGVHGKLNGFCSLTVTILCHVVILKMKKGLSKKG